MLDLERRHEAYRTLVFQYLAVEEELEASQTLDAEEEGEVDEVEFQASTPIIRNHYSSSSRIMASLSLAQEPILGSLCPKNEHAKKED